MHSLPVFLRLHGQAVILLGEGEAADAKHTLLERAGAIVVGEADAARLAIVAIDDDADAETAVTRLKSRGLLVNAVDRPTLCDFTLPAIIDRDPVLVAIGTGGASAGLAKALRQRLEALLPPSVGELALALARARAALRQSFPESNARRHAIDAALNPGGPLDPLSAYQGDAVERWLAEPEAGARGGFHHIILSSDDPDELTLRQARLLGQADQIFYTERVSPAILARGRADAVRKPCSAWPDSPCSGVTLYLERC